MYVSKKASTLRVTGLVGAIHRWLVDSPHKWPATPKLSPFDDIIMGHVFFEMSQAGFNYPVTHLWNRWRRPNWFVRSSETSQPNCWFKIWLHIRGLHTCWTRHNEFYSKNKDDGITSEVTGCVTEALLPMCTPIYSTNNVQLYVFYKTLCAK